MEVTIQVPEKFKAIVKDWTTNRSIPISNSIIETLFIQFIGHAIGTSQGDYCLTEQITIFLEQEEEEIEDLLKIITI